MNADLRSSSKISSLPANAVAHEVAEYLPERAAFHEMQGRTSKLSRTTPKLAGCSRSKEQLFEDSIEAQELLSLKDAMVETHCDV